MYEGVRVGQETKSYAHDFAAAVRPRRRGGSPALERVEAKIGRAIRRRRRLLELTLQQVGDRCGVSFQQIQKYESAVNTISAAQLYALAQALEAPVSYFYEGIEPE